MKKFFISIIAFLMGTVAFAQDRALTAMFNYSTLYLPDKQQAYVETYLTFDAWTMQFSKGEDGLYHAAAEITLVAKSGDSITYAKKYTLNSPAIKDSTATNFNFVDLQRFALNNGFYTLELSVKDANSTQEPYFMQQRIAILFDSNKPSMSSPQIVASFKKTTSENNFSRYGYDIEPYISDFIPEQVSQMHFYDEIYNIQKEVGSQPFLVYAYIEDVATGKRAQNIQYVKRQESLPLVPVIASLDISKLPSGNYNLVVAAHNKDNLTLLYKKTPFFRSNPSVKATDEVSPYSTSFAALITDEEQMNNYLKALYPIATSQETHVINDIVKNSNLEEKQAFLFHFWADRYQLNAEEKWREYRSRIEYVIENFSYPRTPGYLTDRGRVYLQYGAPDYIRDEKNFVSMQNFASKPNAANTNTETMFTSGPSQSSNGQIFYLPYQLWRYNKPERDDANRVFIFWDEFRSGFYKLLVSNARGELQDPLWERRLSQQQLDEDVIGEVGEQFRRGH